MPPGFEKSRIEAHNHLEGLPLFIPRNTAGIVFDVQ